MQKEAELPRWGASPPDKRGSEGSTRSLLSSRSSLQFRPRQGWVDGEAFGVFRLDRIFDPRALTTRNDRLIASGGSSQKAEMVDDHVDRTWAFLGHQ
jgi:hypothetical protein